MDKSSVTSGFPIELMPLQPAMPMPMPMQMPMSMPMSMPMHMFAQQMQQLQMMQQQIQMQMNNLTSRMMTPVAPAAPVVDPTPAPAPEPVQMLTPANLDKEKTEEATLSKVSEPYTPPHKRTISTETHITLINHKEFPKYYPIRLDPRKTQEFKWLQSIIDKHNIKFILRNRNGQNKNCSLKNESFPHFTFCVNYYGTTKHIANIMFYDDRYESEYDGLIVRMIEFYEDGGVRRYSIYDPVSKHYHVALYKFDSGSIYRVIEKKIFNSFDKEDIIKSTDFPSAFAHI
jgi:hypothetical protein